MDDFQLIDGAVEAIRQMGQLGYATIVVTNQSGIGRGYYSEKDFLAVNTHMLALLADERVAVTDVYYCPHSPDASCSCRKPAPGMILRAGREHGLDLSASWMVGDKASDIEAARRAGVANTVLVRSGQPIDEAAAKAVFVRDSIRDIVPLLASEP